VDGLVAAGQVNNAEPSHPQAHGAFDIDSLIVRTTVNDGLAHAMDINGIRKLVLPPDHACYSAHG
jgi:hypothetical protein